jgi:hypothetical protein
MKATCHDGRCRWKCEISDAFFDTQAEQERHTATLIAEQGPNLTLDERRAIFNSVVSPRTR